MKPDYEKIQAVADFKSQQRKLKKAMGEEIKDADIVICIKTNNYDTVGIADYISNVLRDTSGVHDFATFAFK